MTTDITELAQSLKAAAEKATPGQWVYFPKNTSIEYDVGSDESQGSILYVDSGDFTQAQTDRNGEFIALANPANILALVEALEKAQHRIDELENDEVRQRLANAEHQLYMAELAKHNLKASRKAQFRKRRAAEKRIAELEEAEQKLCAANVTLDARAELAERQLAELESRSVTVKLPDLRQVVSGDRYVWSDGVFNYSQDVKAELTAKGIKWEAE
ncbi:TPA: ead/Ea22-like family protein [Klebsiella pneumoniae]|uniref:ead/Ea22-like family protein n=2 Tax=Klebsiella pneumoniae TaxID=573 RepID=UPI0004191DC8|nr:ead/Ea22-like family protein [Klebsiella pneumoniae]MCS5791579.1 ead/Ea22-like family protein [Klebsiella pneumoniae subsp. pneumoniae]TNB87265.1 ead/Ea22-like family protein [Klebsiella pneumoniae]SAU69383.1 RelE family toxin-antitoxin system [Klebsiella pneumoniae]SBK27141.1 RelE family toxin-antitoxin system [Klebsiella pneumoniae]HBQ1970326.1 ead/Ea22-like family protein [Klebsiella pneumoniae]